MTFLKQVKYTILAFLVVGVIGLLYLLIPAFKAPDLIKFDFTEDKLNVSRIVLLTWEFFWLSTIAAGAIFLAKRATDEGNKELEERLEIFESKFFKYVIAILFIAAFLSLVVPAFVGDGLPHYRVNQKGEEVQVIASQYAFTIDNSELKTGTKYVFKLQTTDTTHGFGLYDPNGVLLLQAQIVPDYTTNLVYTFDDTGVYTVRCMEYCGVLHHTMEAPLNVT